MLFIGDIVGSPGRRAVEVLVPVIRERESVDWVVANGENSAGGNGITAALAHELLSCGVDIITTGDHVWDQKELLPVIDQLDRVLRPANHAPEVPGVGHRVLFKEGVAPLGVINLQGRTFMPAMENPFVAARDLVARCREQTPVILVDFHAEATSEKIAMGRFLDGTVSVVVGTHTHVQTADERVFLGGTAYLTDAGFTGPHDSILGREVAPGIRRFLTGLPQRFGVAKDDVRLQGALVDVDELSGHARWIRRVDERLLSDATDIGM